jgi:hypothetical protein
VNLDHGFVPTDPAVAGTLNGVSLSLEHGATDENNQKSSTSGAEIEAGNGSVGIALGYLKRDCEACKGRTAGMLGASMDSFAFGLGYYEEDTYSAGILINPKGTHRVGLVASGFDSENDGQDVRAYGLGYSYNAQSLTFALDASKRTNETEQPTDKVVLITPGLQVRVSHLALSVSHDFYTNNEAKTYTDKTWYGVGFGSSNLHLAIYHDYFHEWAAVGTIWF